MVHQLQIYSYTSSTVGGVACEFIIIRLAYLVAYFLFQANHESILSSSLSLNANQHVETEDEPIDNLYLALIQCFGIILCG